MTNYHVLNKKDIYYGKSIKFQRNEKEFNIWIDDSRVIYSNEKYDISFFEIKPEDNLDTKYFLQIDKQILTQKAENYYKSKIYLIKFNKDKKNLNIHLE